MRLSLFLPLMVILILISCNVNVDSEYFKGKIIVNESETETVNVNMKPLCLYGNNYGELAVYDSLLFFMNPKLDRCFYQIFNVETGEEIGQYFNKGYGPLEYIALSPIYHFYKENNELKTLLFAPYQDKLIEWNITLSLKYHKTIIDNEYTLNWREDNAGACYNLIYRLNKDLILAKVQTLPINDEEATLPKYQIRYLETNVLWKEFSSYKLNKFSQSDTWLLPEEVFTSLDAIKPDGSKLCQAMSYLPQLNIIDLETGEVNGYRMENSNGFVSFEKSDFPKNRFYTRKSQADDKYIYSIYWGKIPWEKDDLNNIPCVDLIHVYNWDGKIVKVIQLDECINNMFLDRVKNRLYISSPMNDNINYIELSDLNLYD